jgi:trans-4-hydroxy-L-proline dehydratase
MTRTERLKARLFEMDDRAVCLERVAILERCSERYADETAGRKFGRTLGELLSDLTIVIEADDLIVGRVPEVVPTEEEERWFEARRKDHFRPGWFYTDGHLTLSWERLLKEGLEGIRERARKRLAEIRDVDGISLSQRDFLEGTILCCNAIPVYARRYAEAAAEMALGTDDPARARELREISQICRWVPARPARTLHEAVQALWLVDLVLHAVVGARDFTPGRLDQYLYPFYKADLDAGRITPEAAQELIECLFIKCHEIIGFADQANARKRSPCQDSVQYVILGGQTEDGRDATNSLSTICLKAGFLRLKQPTIKVRYHRGIDRDFWRETCALARAGGSLGIYNDEVVIPAFESVGVDPIDARNYVHYGCCNANVPGKEGSLMERWHSLPKFLELALNNGLDPISGEQTGPETGDPDAISSIDDLIEACRLQMRHALQQERSQYPPLTDRDRERFSFTLESVFLEGCIENGREWRLGGTQYWHKSQHGSGIATVADSLAAIQEVVYDSDDLTLGELRDILSSDFEGHEPLRQRLLNRCPKYGNDDDRADRLAEQIANAFCDEVVRCNEMPHSIRFWPEIYSYHNNRGLGTRLGATADGRRQGEPISENQSPSYGMDLEGATACLRSQARLPHSRTPGGGTNLRLHTSAVAGERGLEALSDLLETYFGLGGQHLQLNVVDEAMLREAQRNPEANRSLSVRVVGYSAYFVALSENVQEDLIRRTEHEV